MQNEMTDWEKAIAHWLPQVWTPGRKCEGVLFPENYHARDECPYICAACGYATAPMNAGLASRIIRDHDKACPSPSRSLGLRLLEAMVAKGFQPSLCYAYEVQEWGCGVEFVDDDLGFVKALPDVVFDLDPLTAITKASAALARQNEKKE